MMGITVHNIESAKQRTIKELLEAKEYAFLDKDEDLVFIIKPTTDNYTSVECVTWVSGLWWATNHALSDLVVPASVEIKYHVGIV